MVMTVCQDRVSVEEGSASPPWGRRERGLVDLTQMDMIDRHVGLPLSKWRWQGVNFFSR